MIWGCIFLYLILLGALGGLCWYTAYHPPSADSDSDIESFTSDFLSNNTNGLKAMAIVFWIVLGNYLILINILRIFSFINNLLLLKNLPSNSNNENSCLVFTRNSLSFACSFRNVASCFDFYSILDSSWTVKINLFFM